MKSSISAYQMDCWHQDCRAYLTYEIENQKNVT